MEPLNSTKQASLSVLGQSDVIVADHADVGATRERARQGRVRRVALLLAPVALWLAVRALLFPSRVVELPHFPHGLLPYLPAMALMGVLCLVMVIPLLGAGRSPHVMYRPSEIKIRLDDVRGAETVVEEVVKSLNLFLAHKTFSEQMGGSPRRALLFEGPPGTGKTYMAKAMAYEAGVPFLFVS